MRLLRAELRTQNINNHRSQLVLERIRAQQDQVVRLRRDIGDIRDRLDDIKGLAQKKKRALDDWKAMTKDWVELVEPNDIKALVHEVEELENREQSLVRRETLLTADLGAAETDLADLNRRLDEIDWEMSQQAAGEDGNPVKRQ